MLHLPGMSQLRSVVPFVVSLAKRRPIVTYSVGAVVLASIIWYLTASGSTTKAEIVVSPSKGEFLVTVTTTGELQAKNSINILGAESARSAGVWGLKITNLVAEGTIVKKGDFVGELDKSDIAQRLKDSQLSLEKLEAQYTQATLDSALNLAQARDDLVNLSYAQEEKKIALDQSVYEAPAMRRQAEIDFERSQRTLEQAKKNYITKTHQAIAKMQAVGVDRMREQQRLEIYMKAVEQFTVKAPADGMVIYAREWGRNKKVVGSTVDSWNPIIATLPDLKDMESITFVNEVDIQKIAVGQKAKLRLDADPKKQLTGSVTAVANIGEQRPNSDSKVFEVRIHVVESDTTLRPSMTTANEILVARLDNVMSIPLECVHTEGGTTYVYKKTGGLVKQEVKLGMLNDNAAVVLGGLEEKDQLLLTIPPEPEKLKMNFLAQSR